MHLFLSNFKYSIYIFGTASLAAIAAEAYRGEYIVNGDNARWEQGSDFLDVALIGMNIGGILFVIRLAQLLLPKIRSFSKPSFNLTTKKQAEEALLRIGMLYEKELISKDEFEKESKKLRAKIFKE